LTTAQAVDTLPVYRDFPALPNIIKNIYKIHFMCFIKHHHWLKDKSYTLFSVQFLAHQLVMNSLLTFQILPTLSSLFPSLLLASWVGKNFSVIY
jgi:hypothetical protein